MQLLDLILELRASAPAKVGIIGPRGVQDFLIEDVLQAYRTADSVEREAASRSLSRNAGYLLINFAREAAAVAVRTGAATRVKDGLLALAVENGQTDLRDDVVALAILFRSSERLGMDSLAVFEEAADFAANPALRIEMRGFPLRRKKDLAQFWIEEVQTNEGVAYLHRPQYFAKGVRRAKRATFFKRLRDKLLG